MVLLLEESERLGFLGPGSAARHIDHSVGFVEVLGSLSDEVRSRPLLDLGSGGGVPGLVIAAHRSNLQTVLLDGSARRARWLKGAIERLGLAESVTVVGERAEVAGRSPEWRHNFGIVVARLFARPGVTAECAAPLLAPQGVLVVSEPVDTLRSPLRAEAHNQSEEAGQPDSLGSSHGRLPPVGERWPREGLALLGLGPARRVSGGGYSFAMMRCRTECGDRFPRRTGIPAKRPLF